MEFLENVVTTFNDGVWTYILPWLLIGAGLLFGARTAVVQIRKVPDMLRAVVERPNSDDEDEGAGSGGISAFKAFTISAASRVGTGNVAGVAVAISVGGPGAVFWMWIIALLGGATAFVESTLAQLWKVRNGDTYRGGPAYYMKRGLGWGPLGVLFSIAIVFTFGLVYNSFQTNAIVEAVAFSFGREDDATFGSIIGIIIAIAAGLIIFGGVKRIANITQVVVPFMALAYLLIGGFVVITNFDKVPGMLGDIIGHALGFKEIAGAGISTAMMKGIQRGLFSNEAGEGSAPNAAATATVSHPVKQGLVQTLGVYFDTIVVCILAFSSILGNYYLAEANLEYLTTNKTVLNTFRLVVLFFVWFGAVGSLPLVFALADTGAATMVILNIIAIVPLSGVAIQLLKNFNEQRSKGVDPVFHRDMLPGVPGVECWDGSDPVTRRSAADRKILRDRGEADRY